MSSPVVTCDVFSALTDSRAGATAFLAGLGRPWPVPPEAATDPDGWSGLRVGLLTNTDDDLLRPTRAARLAVVEAELVVTSETVRAYKPAPLSYRRARAHRGRASRRRPAGGPRRRPVPPSRRLTDRPAPPPPHRS